MAILIIAYPKARFEKTGKEQSKWAKRGYVALSIIFQLINSAFTVFASFFGPVSIVIPTSVSAQMLSNMVIFRALRLEGFSNDVRVGTYIVALAAIVLPIAGPQIQDDQDTVALFLQPGSLVMIGLQGIAMFVSLVGCIILKRNKTSGTTSAYVWINVAQVTGRFLGNSISRLFIFVETRELFVAAFLAWGVTGLIRLYATVLQATAVEQKTFVPLNTTATQIGSAITGLVLFHDYAAIGSGIGYQVCNCHLADDYGNIPGVVLRCS